MKFDAAEFSVRTLVFFLVSLLLLVSPPGSAAEAETDAGGLFRERSIYVPFNKLHRIFEQDGRGVFMPYEDFMALWKAARKPPPETSSAAPVDSLISAVTGRVEVQGEVVAVTAKLRIEVFKEGWTQIPLSLQDAAVQWASLEGEPARLIPRQGGGSALLVKKEGTAPKQLELELGFAKVYSTTPGRNTVTFAAPQAAVSQWTVVIPSPGVDVDISPALAVTQSAENADAEQTEVVAYVGATPQITIGWTPKSEGARGLDALASVEADTRVTVKEGIVRTRTALAYAISRASLSQLQVDVPADHRVINVYDPNVREWRLAKVEGRQRITAELFEAAEDSQQLVIELECFREQTADAPLAIPVIEARDVHRQQGSLLIDVADSLRAEIAGDSGLMQMDKQELPAALQRGQHGIRWDFAWRYASLPYELALRVEKIKPRILAETMLAVHLQPESITLDAALMLDVQRSGVFQFTLRIPDGYDIRNLQGATVRSGITAASVDSQHRTEEGLLEINLDRQAKGPVGLRVQLERKLTAPALLSPSGKAASLSIPLVRVISPFLTSESGHLIVYSPESLRLNADSIEGLRAVSPEEAAKDWTTQYASSRERPALAFHFAEPAVEFTLDAERRRPHVAVRQLLTTRVEPGVVRHDLRLHYSIRYSGVQALHVALPAEITERIRLVTSGLQRSLVNAPENASELPPDSVVWQLVGESEMLGSRTVRFLWEDSVEDLGKGQGKTLTIPRIVPLNADRSWGQIVLTKAEFIDLQPLAASAGLRPIDPQYDLAANASIPDAARAFEFHDDWSLKVKVRRYEARDVKTTSIERGLLRTVLTRGGVSSVQALYRMRSARQRLVVQLPESVSFDSRPLRINGRPVALEEGAAGEFHIPLAGQNKNKAFLLELRYTLPDGPRRLHCPVFPNEPATQKIYLSVYVPSEQAYLGYRGPWHDEMVWAMQGVSALPRPVKSTAQLLNWVSSGVSDKTEEIGDFPADGMRLLYSTLRPAADTEASLRLLTLRRSWLNLAILIVGIGIGLALLPARAPRRILVIGIILLALLAVDVFWESLVIALVTNASVSGAAIVLVLWAMKYLLVDRPADLRAKHAARITPPPPPPPALKKKEEEKKTAGQENPPPAPETAPDNAGDRHRDQD